MYYWLSEDDLSFPHPTFANAHGILAIGGDLSPQRILLAYENGIFPWYNEDEPIIWWSPDPRFVLYPTELKVSKSMRKVLRDEQFSITYDTDFRAVITECRQAPRHGQDGTWIHSEIIEAYCQLHELGIAHSVEVWQNNKLVGGLYGIGLGRCFCGESMFAKVSNASKAGFVTFVKKLESHGFDMIDCQTHSKHLESLGAKNISRADFLEYLNKNKTRETIIGNWGEWLL